MRPPLVKFWLSGNMLALLVSLYSTSATPAADLYVARPALTFEYTGEPPMRMPTGVAVAADGGVFIADGVNDRVLQFDAQGHLVHAIDRVGEDTLSRPISVRLDGTGRLWIADTGHSRALVMATDGSLAGTLQLEQGGLAKPPSVTDVAPRADGHTAWLVDGHNQRLVLFDLTAGIRSAVGEKGESLGQFDYPFMLALDREGELLVSEAVNARVQVLSASGRPAGSIGSFGAELGQLYRPKGVACDSVGNVWVADGVLDVVQVFTPDGAIRDVVRDPEGKPLKLEMPIGLALDSAGNLYVAELLGDRVRKFSIEAQPGSASLPAAAQRRVATVGQQRSCTVCHIEWLEPFASGRGTALMDVPVSTPEQPAVSRAKTCLSCHDGSVVDSRRRVWQEHGHSANSEPPPDMKVPLNLPLVNGRLACRTCHSAHTTGAPTGDISQAVFLRVANVASELCISCHPDKTRGPELGTHPTGGMPWPVPQKLIEAGARVGPNPRELTCQVCHTPHGASHEHLLVLGTETSQLCLTCHEQMRPGMFVAGAAEHPLSPKASPEQVAAVREMGTKLGPDDHLICLSCHKLHHGKGKRFMLADDLHDGRMCLRCHADRNSLFGTPHDLRTNFPEERNRLGMTPDTGGPCSACHLFHRYARAPEASTLDPGGGKCITCHQAGRIAQNKVLGDVNHTQARCTQCHNPHDLGTGHFLAAPVTELCGKCHEAEARLAGSSHDRSRGSKAWPADSQSHDDRCLPCHRPHGNEQTKLFRIAPVADMNQHDGACLACHAAAAPTAKGNDALLHPRTGNTLKVEHRLPLVEASAGQDEMGCRTCHNPHSPATSGARLLRNDGPAAPDQPCVACHIDRANIRSIGHADQYLQAAGFATGQCLPCHTTHGDPTTVVSPLWPKSLTNYEGYDNVPVANRYCVACHRTGGPVAPPSIFSHPKVEMFDPEGPDAPGYLPLFNEQGQVDPRGTIGCRTCHLTHGRSSAAIVPQQITAPGARETRARQWHIRTYGPGSVCATCHGADGLRRFMYFHDSTRRGGPIQGGPPVPTPARTP